MSLQVLQTVSSLWVELFISICYKCDNNLINEGILEREKKNPNAHVLGSGLEAEPGD